MLWTNFTIKKLILDFKNISIWNKNFIFLQKIYISYIAALISDGISYEFHIYM